MTKPKARVVDKETGEWSEHPRFKGIMIKRLLTSEDNPLANINLVRVPPGCLIGEHTHSPQVETIFVLSGQCKLSLDRSEVQFNAGQIVAVPVNVNHFIRNDGREMVELLTLFTPPQ